MEIAAELVQIIINEEVDQQIVVVRESAGQQRAFPIVIGMPEILAIDRRLKGIELPRPMTHDLLEEIIEQMGGVLQKVVITELREHTFYAALHVLQDGEMLEIDSRPSDALALTAGRSIPLFVDDQIFEQLKM